MKHGTFIYLLVILALCASQMASNVHFAMHLHAVESHAHAIDHVHAIGEDSIGHHHHHHLADAGRDTESEPASSLGNCAIYHAYAGMAGLSPATQKPAVKQATHRLAPVAHRSSVATRSIETQPIRGPPALS